jgi:hypothetical protein
MTTGKKQMGGMSSHGAAVGRHVQSAHAHSTLRVVRACHPARRSPSRRGSAYLLVLAVATIVATLGLGAMLAVRAQARAAGALGGAAQTRYYALSGIDLGRLWISQDALWRAHRDEGVWATTAIGSGSVKLEASDPMASDLARARTDLARWPHDDLILKATAVNPQNPAPGQLQTRQILEVRLEAHPEPIPALAYSLVTGGELVVAGGKTLTAGPGRISTNGSLNNSGTILGSVEALSATNIGTIGGAILLGVPPKGFPTTPVPGVSVPQAYAALGTTITPGNKIEKRALGPGVNPWGATDPDGVYVIQTNSDLTIQDSRIVGTLVVICPGKKVTLNGHVLLQPARGNLPALIVDGDLKLGFTSADPLSEADRGTNYNPPGAPYPPDDPSNNSTDNDLGDQYPSEIQGLVHVTGKIEVSQPCRIRGAVICESTALKAINCNSDWEIVYDPALFTSRTKIPQMYTTRVTMQPQPASWKQVVE